MSNGDSDDYPLMESPVSKFMVMQPQKESLMAQVTYPSYWQKKDNSGQWYWIYYAKNGEEISRSSESYIDRNDCTHSITLMKNSSADQIWYTE